MLGGFQTQCGLCEESKPHSLAVPKRVEATGKWELMRDYEVHNLYSTSNIIREMNATKIGKTNR
jgi:hypothetical protein